MHLSAYKTGKIFFDVYTKNLENFSTIEIGSQDVNGSLRDHRPNNCSSYIGLDFVPGKGVDLVLTDPYKYPLEDESCDVIVTSSCLEHSEMFWLTFLEALRILKPHGLFYCNVPSSWMMYHRWPVDCWRFYPDASKALETWARHNNINSMVLESYVCPPGLGEYVADYVFIILKDASHLSKYPNRIIDNLKPYKDFFNAFRFPPNEQYPDGWEKPIGEIKQDVLLPLSDGTLQLR